MSRELRVHFLPELFEPHELRGGVAVVIDVLRASTTIIHALANGADAVIPAAEVDEARRISANLAAGTCLSGGERAGVRIEGFDLDNSPLAYTRDVVNGKTIVFTTTNGTRALLRSSNSERVLVGAFSNLNAIVGLLAVEDRPIHLVCAGTDGYVSSEDVLCVGAIAAGAVEATTGTFAPDDEREIAMRFFHAHNKGPSALYDCLLNSRGGRNLQELGYSADIRQAAQCHVHSVVPQYFPESGTIIIPRSQALLGNANSRNSASHE